MVYAEKENPVVYSDSKMTDEAKHADVKFNVNENNQTYGTDVESPYVDDLPDLMSAVGDNGKSSYIYADELFKSPSSPQEALKIQESIDNGTYIPKVLNVYASDGKTVIDTLTEVIS